MENLKGEELFQALLKKAVEEKASDIHLKTGIPPVVRVGGTLRLLTKALVLTNEMVDSICQNILTSVHREKVRAGKEVDLAYSLPKVGRFRLNIFKHRSQIGIIARFIPFEIKTIDELGLPGAVRSLAQLKRGLVLVTGTAGSGKSTTMAAMIQEWNNSRGGHIITIEDPIEYLIRDRKAIITQREVGLDTENFDSGLKYALRQDPDVIMIGELRDRETIVAALNAAETGHLVFSTLHTRDAKDTVNRIIGVFEPGVQAAVRTQFAASLAGVVSQRLVPFTKEAQSKYGKSNTVACEILINTPRTRSLLMDPTRMDELRKAIEDGGQPYGMQTFDQHLMSLYEAKEISRETALRFSSQPGEFELRLRGIVTSSAHF
ncbi:MAG TPA: PilT/PilU family type 4a pilus ATPase [Bdellovibrionota bacterium]|jgi:twitching motility protein PilT|nr:PilT/PilU family type 4a pilus ATPase [Bdellovibrionota bacterium]